MRTRPFAIGLVLALILSPFAARAATADEEAKFTAAVQKAFESRKPSELSDLTCWDGTPDRAKKSAEQVYQSLMDEKDVTFAVTLESLDDKPFDKERVQDGERYRWNLEPTKRIALTMRGKDQKILGIIGLAVGEKDGKLRLSALTPAK